MKKYHDNKSYNAIVEAMQQIRYNALVEEYGEDEMEEAYMYEEDDEEMAEMSDEEEQMVAEMMDEALYEMDMEDDEDNLNEADDGRKARRRKRLRQALLIGAGLAATGLGIGAGSKFVAQGRLPGGLGQETARAFRGAVGGSIDSLGRMVAGEPGTTQNKIYRDYVRDPLTRGAVASGVKGRRMDADMNPLGVRGTGDVVVRGVRVKGDTELAKQGLARGAKRMANLKRFGAANY